MRFRIRGQLDPHCQKRKEKTKSGSVALSSQCRQIITRFKNMHQPRNQNRNAIAIVT
jgi:hypothetical protein